jgi:hypothetical protein
MRIIADVNTGKPIDTSRPEYRSLVELAVTYFFRTLGVVEQPEFRKMAHQMMQSEQEETDVTRRNFRTQKKK